jgi:predicted nucleotidyltransferase
MNSLARAIQRAISHFEREGRPFALVGGLAVSARTEPRFTRDADFAVAVSNDKEAEAMVRRFSASGYRIVTLVEQEAVSRLATVRLSLAEDPSTDVVVDLLFASSGIEREVAEAADTFEIMENLMVPVSQLGHLLALKILSRDDQNRPQDAADINSLIKVADDEELTRARDAVALIMQRGFHRNRDLATDLELAMARAE